MNEPAPFVPAPAPAPEEKTEPKQIGGDQSRAHFQETKARALEDKTVRDLQEKADNAAEGDAQRKATREYYETLYNKMRKLDPALKNQIDRTESATMRRLKKSE